MKFTKGKTIKHRGKKYTLDNISTCPDHILKHFVSLGLIEIPKKQAEKKTGEKKTGEKKSDI